MGAPKPDIRHTCHRCMKATENLNNIDSTTLTPHPLPPYPTFVLLFRLPASYPSPRVFLQAGFDDLELLPISFQFAIPYSVEKLFIGNIVCGIA